jgi:hypothetical protein
MARSRGAVEVVGADAGHALLRFADGRCAFFDVPSFTAAPTHPSGLIAHASAIAWARFGCYVVGHDRRTLIAIDRPRGPGAAETG